MFSLQNDHSLGNCKLVDVSGGVAGRQSSLAVHVAAGSMSSRLNEQCDVCMMPDRQFSPTAGLLLCLRVGFLWFAAGDAYRLPVDLSECNVTIFCTTDLPLCIYVMICRRSRCVYLKLDLL